MLKTTTIETRRRHRHRWFPVAVLAMICAQAQAPLAFAAQSVQFSDPNLKYYQLAGSGTTNPSKLIWYAMDKLEEMAGTPLRMTYRSVGSGTGATDWNSNDAGDFASTDYGLASASGAAAFMQLPFQIGAVSLFINIPGVGTGEMKRTAILALPTVTLHARGAPSRGPFFSQAFPAFFLPQKTNVL